MFIIMCDVKIYIIMNNISQIERHYNGLIWFEIRRCTCKWMPIQSIDNAILMCFILAISCYCETGHSKDVHLGWIHQCSYFFLLLLVFLWGSKQRIGRDITTDFGSASLFLAGGQVTLMLHSLNSRSPPMRSKRGRGGRTSSNFGNLVNNLSRNVGTAN